MSKNKELIDERKSQDMNKKLEVLNTLPVSDWAYPRVAVAVLQERAMSYASETFYQFWGIAQQGVPILRLPYGRTDQIRNKIGLLTLEHSHITHVIMLDIDHIHPLNVVQHLSKWFILYPELQVVGGLNFRRSAPYEPCGFILGQDGKYYSPQDWEPGLLEVDAIGTGCIMISRDVFLELEPPYFYNDYSQVWADIWPGEDMGFSKKCRDAGIKMYMDTTLTSPHLTPGAIDEASFRQYIDDKNTPHIPIEDFKAARSQDNDKQV